jgi:hypothetical protein
LHQFAQSGFVKRALQRIIHQVDTTRALAADTPVAGPGCLSTAEKALSGGCESAD